MEDANDWQDVTQVAPAPAAGSASSDPGDWQEVTGQATDKLTGATVPLALSGNSPETAMNKNPLSAMDRLKLSLGNEAGNINYLKSQYPDARPINGPDGKPTKDLALKSGDKWYRVNPKAGDIQDPWERTKEYLKEAATFAPEAVGGAVALGTDVLTEGMALPASAAIAGGAAAGVRTSLGRIVGTYDASPSEQAWDIGFESLLNAGGAKVLAGVKPTAKYVAGKLTPLAEAFSDTVAPMVPNVLKKGAQAVGGAAEYIADSPKTMFKKVFGSYSVGENNFDTMVENTERVKALMSQVSDMTSGAPAGAYHDEVLRQQMGSVQNIAEGTRGMLSDVYGSMRNKLLAKIPANFSANLEEPVYAAYSDALKRGIGVLKVGGQELSGKDAMDYLAAKGAKNTGFRLYTQDELQGAIQQGAALSNGLGYLAADKEAHGILSEFYSSLDKFVGGANRTGTQGARDLLDFKKVATDLSQKMSGTEAARSIPELKMIINQARSSMDDSVFQAFKKENIGSEFQNLNSTYNNLSDKFAPLLKAKEQFDKTGNANVYQGLLNTFLARPGKNATARFAVDDAIAAADANGQSGWAKDLAENKLAIQVGEAAKAFNPIKGGQLKADAIGAGQVGIMGYAAMTHNPYLIAAGVGMQALRSPGVSSAAISTVQGLSQGQEILSKMSKKGIDQLLSNPKAIDTFMTAVTSAPMVRSQAQDKMQGMLQQMVQSTQQATQRTQQTAQAAGAQ